MLDEAKVDCLELAIPFPKSASDGPVIRASASRALEDGIDREAVLDFIQRVRPELSHLKIALLADWSYSIKGTPMKGVPRARAGGRCRRAARPRPAAPPEARVLRGGR